MAKPAKPFGPAWVYSKTGEARLIKVEAEYRSLRKAGWADTPAAFKPSEPPDGDEDG